jgi:predicted nucleic acid-binding Zn ribbon protein
MTAKRRVKCPECGGRTKKKIGAGAGIIFKGSGFYETDYRRKSHHASAGETSAAKPDESKKEEKKSDTRKAD